MKSGDLERQLVIVCLAAALTGSLANQAVGQAFPNRMAALSRLGMNATEAKRVAEGLYQAPGFGNTFLIVTGKGNVVVDTSLPFMAPRHIQLLSRVSKDPVAAIIVTHAHEDHVGGIGSWRGPETSLVAHRLFLEQIAYQERLAGFFRQRNAAQFALPSIGGEFNSTRARPELVPSIVVDDRYVLAVGEEKFEIHHCPGETPDHLNVWWPSRKAAFVGDNFYDSFPNIYTLRGCRPRWALDYIASIDKVRGWKPEILLPSHGDPIVGADRVESRLKQYRDAIAFVHDAVVAGMNQGKDVFTLMREIKLPKELEVGEAYGKVDWSVRGIYEGYVGWFNGDPATMYGTPPEAIVPDLVILAGGPDKVVSLGRARLSEGRTHEALHLAGAALAADPKHAGARELRVAAFTELKKSAKNVIEGGWLDAGIRAAKTGQIRVK